jgi:predicted ATP-dependent protease
MDNTLQNILTLAQKRRHVALLQKLKDGKTLSQRDMAELASLEKGKKEKISFAERMANNLKAKNKERLSAQEIGPLPEVVNPERKAIAATNFKFFCEQYFPDIFYLAWSEDHLRVIAKIEKSVLEGGLFAFAMPRGSWKSALTMAAAVWAIFTGARPNSVKSQKCI